MVWTDQNGQVFRHLVGLHYIDADLPVFNPEIVALQLDVQAGKDQLVANHLPDDPRHFVAIHLNDWVLDFDLAQMTLLQSGFRGSIGATGGAAMAAKGVCSELAGITSNHRVRSVPAKKAAYAGELVDS